MNRRLRVDRLDHKPESIEPARSLCDELVDGDATFAVSFAGQGAPAIEELAEIYHDNPSMRWLFSIADQVIESELSSEAMRWSGLYTHGLPLRQWLVDADSRPDVNYLVQSHISHPIVFLSQLCRYLLLLESGLDRALPSLRALTGHSQGVLTALLLSESGGRVPQVERIRNALTYNLWQGFWSQQGRPEHAGEGTCMVAISGPRESELRDLINRVQRKLPAEHSLYIALQNTPTRAVVSSTPEALHVLRTTMERTRDQHVAARKEGKRGGRPLSFRWEPLAVGSPFHCPHLDEIRHRMHETAREKKLTFGPLILPVYDPSGQGRFTDGDDLVHRLIDNQFIQSVQWCRTVRLLALDIAPTVLIDCGPGDGVAKLAHSSLRGMGVATLSAMTTAGQEALFTVGAPRPTAEDWSVYQPSLVTLPDGSVVLETKYSRATGQSPVILAGMTPTTVDVPICAAAANAGFTAELAGGGQVTEEIFETRMDELSKALVPGAEVVFNALLLDPWLFGLHLGDKALVQRARARGVPIRGVTMSGGVPEVEQGVALLDQLASLGMKHNAFKPGTVDQVDSVLRIAAAAPRHTIFVHLEGGHAGGHHSWEDLDELLLLTYGRLRSAPNIVLCVGGGIADPGRATDLITGRWAHAHGERAMPVDAVFLGTVTMAVAESTASPAVKAALVGAEGCEGWVPTSTANGGVTSGRSGLNADIHYLDNPAARCGALLDEVAGDAEAVAARREEIIEALNATAKPYFGDVESMTYGQLLDRMVELMAVGKHTPYEDGPWPDRSYRDRVLDAVRRAESRCHPEDSGTITSVVQSPDQLDHPAAVLAALRDALPQVDSTRVLPADGDWFVRAICARKGKPVNFVPVIDGDVRRWYKSDSLWQAQDDRFRADQVLVLPGPAGVAGITQVDEPVCDLLGRFEQGVVSELLDRGVQPTGREWRRGSATQLDGEMGQLFSIRGQDEVPTAWSDLVSTHFTGAVAGLFGAERVSLGDRRIPNPVRAMVVAAPKAQMEVTHRDGVLVSARWHDGAESVEIRNGGKTIRLVAGQLKWSFRPTLRADGWAFVLDQAQHEKALRAFYGETLVGEPFAKVKPFESVEREHTLGTTRARAHASITGSPNLLPDLAFSAAWEAILGAQAVPGVGYDLLRLVHLDHEVTLMASPRRLAGTVTSTATLVGTQTSATGRTLEVEVHLRDDDGELATLRERFFVRDPGGAAETHRRESMQRSITLDAAAAAFLNAQSWTSSELAPGPCEVAIDVELHSTASGTTASARGQLTQHGTTCDVSFDAEGTWTRHPVVEALGLLTPTAGSPVARRTVAQETISAPLEMTTFAEVGGDRNPIHTSSVIARLAGLQTPIVHGMWSSAALQALVVRVAGGDAERITRWRARFLDVVLPGESLQLTVLRTGVDKGSLLLEATATIERDGATVTVLSAEATVKPKRTAVVFPGQGIQQRGMGMEALETSRAARAVWERADAHTRRGLGFSILTVVRNNPTTLRVGGETFHHPEGVLHLTRFTQVAMAVLATAQVAQLREADLLAEGQLFAGHSIGEYNALSALAGVLPLETVVEVVYHRGATMERLVPRDAQGRSPYAMAAVRPRMARLDEAGLLELVAQVRERAGFLEVVNFNIRDMQYAIAGELDALQVLEAEIVGRIPPGGKPAWTLVPGIDVPFHSRRLRQGVPDFRDLLDRVLPQDIDADDLIGRYIPNLVARPFSLDAEFIAEMVRVTGDDSLHTLLDRPADKQARAVLVELLAWQFASPVRWVETQELLFSPTGLGIKRFLEIGVGYQPTVRNMAARTLQGWGGHAPDVQLLNIDADAEAVFLTDTDPAPVIEAVEEVEESAPAEVAEAAPRAPVAPATPVTDVPMDLTRALQILLALQAGVRVEQLRNDETIDELFDGVSSKRNQVLLDLGAEFSVGTIDAAHERPLDELIGELTTRCGSYTPFGPFLRGATDDLLRRSLAGWTRRDVEKRLQDTYGLAAGLQNQVIAQLALDLRSGDSVRGGSLGTLGEIADASAASAAVDATVTAVGQRLGITLSAPTAANDESADPAALRALREDLLGPDGALMTPLKALAERLGHPVQAPPSGLPQVHEDAERLRLLDAEVGADASTWLRPAFDARRHVCFDDAWANARRDISALPYEDLDDDALAAEVARLSRFADDTHVSATAAWFMERSRPSVAAALKGLRTTTATPYGPAGMAADFLADMVSAPLPSALFDALRDSLGETWDFRGRTALITGASPGSIALDVVRHLLAGGARVIVTTSRLSRERVDAYREVYRHSAGPGAELHLVPFNQASRQDVDALLDWVFSRVTEQAGAVVREVKPAFAPDIILPFAAAGDIATLDEVNARSEVGLRTMLLGVERIVTGVARRYIDEGLLAEPCHVVLPLSPNHGTFGGDGLYGECKAALEAMVNRWSSEHEAWGCAVSLCAATIGWVRGTGLMGGNDVVASAVTERTGARTFSTEEMGWLLAGLCTPELRQQAATAPLRADLSGGLANAQLAEVVREARDTLVREDRLHRQVEALQGRLTERLGEAQPLPPVTLLPGAPSPSTLSSDREHSVDLSRTVVLVGMGELGPCGTSRTRHALEVGDALTPAAVLELAWITGLIRYDAHLQGGSWVDVDSGSRIPEHEIAERYADEVRSRTGVRFMEPAALGVDPEARPVLQSVRLDRDFRFEVGSEDEARTFVVADPSHTLVDHVDGAWFVTRTAGAEMRLPRAVRLTRRVAGMLPTGMDLERWGIGKELQSSTDRLSLINLVSTVEAFASAGLTPEELLRHVHPALVANTQGTGLGGVTSMRRMYTDQLLDVPRQQDILQESLGNVVAAWVVQSYVGSYGPMTHPVAACATAAVSVESGVDKILAGKAEFVVAGGFDDLGVEGTVGFSDMHATAETDEMLAMGLEPDQMSRANDARRKGFVESHGGGTLLLARGDVAARLGLPVRGVVAYAASFSDGVHTSIPAPGKGLLAAVRGGEHSPMARALDTWGLTADDIGVVYKHDTSTAANDPNEAELHHRIQDVLGRTPGNPLWVVSQKTLTGHAKGGAAAWQLIGLAQAMETGIVPANRNLNCVDAVMRKFHHLVHTDRPVRPDTIRAGLVTSLGFGHVNAIILLLNPLSFFEALPADQREAWATAASERLEAAERHQQEVWMGRTPAFTKRTQRPTAADEIALLVDA